MRKGAFLVAFIVAAAAVPIPADAVDDCGCGGMDHSSAPPWIRGLIDLASSPWGWAGGVLVASISVLAWRRGWFSPFAAALALWSRLDPEETTLHADRAEIVRLLREQTGVKTRDLAHMTGLHVGTLLYHLRVLERAGQVCSERRGRHRFWTVPGAARATVQTIAVLGDATRRYLFDLIQETPGLSQVELSRALGRSKATIHHHLGVLLNARMVRNERAGTTTRWFASNPVPVAPNPIVAPTKGQAQPA